MFLNCIFLKSGKSRIPSWCDRVLWHQRSKVSLQWYGRHELLSSDHRPITAIFQVQGRKYIDEKRKEVFAQIIKQLDKQENESIPQVELSPSLLDFEEVSYMTPVTRTATLLNTGGSGVCILLYFHELPIFTKKLFFRLLL